MGQNLTIEKLEAAFINSRALERQVAVVVEVARRTSGKMMKIAESVELLGNDFELPAIRIRAEASFLLDALATLDTLQASDHQTSPAQNPDLPEPPQ